ncbi:septum formation initiator family protein [Leucobacter rhizosphaerae]|uniref:Septum formation initiator family protein n=1 Tax=Leucobacter rhizosphaerae TaxID=2932245 RepID=A0ABY4FVQ1_9MICO|nr:septum formation initiator family protein [Leucobacter rhizosphaerae]UOQ60338.1 septum formation initiator family protein [Leucobacter rhizosphaerae]
MTRWTEDLGAWVSSLRFSGFTVLVVILVLAGAVIVSPSLSTFVQQQREIAELRESVRLSQEAVDEIDAERAKWKDPVYVRAQARDRLFYVLPGETQLSVIDDIIMPVESVEDTDPELSRIQGNWAQGLVVSFLSAGTTDATADELAATDPAAVDPAADPAAADPAATESSTTESEETSP